MEVMKIKNVSETAYRFSTVLKFLPGETVTVSKKDIEAKPVINALIKTGHLQVISVQGAPEPAVETRTVQEVANEPEVVEEV